MSSVGHRAEPASSRVAATAGPAQRLLSTASELFAVQGIRAVGVDQILREAAVAKASLYSTYGSKDALVVAYLADLDQCDRNRWRQAVTDVADPLARIMAFFDLAIASAPVRGFRGCLYANAATEFPGTDLAPVQEHRLWMHTTIAEQLCLASQEATAEVSADLARHIQLVYDGALVGSKIERSVEPLQRARAVALQLIKRDS
jgi:AcrR family transcriptional regulator